MPRHLRSIILAMTGAGALLAAEHPAAAASFDCNNAASPNEIAICGNRQLSELDTEMAALFYAYRTMPHLMGVRGMIQDEARQFLYDREACGTGVVCLVNVYRQRIRQLKRAIANSSRGGY
ncbi:lysozyme inhibitor LprI family protein [Chelatococcus reniformis]|uniref:Lysozyme inhibitor LprI N-terminal domain-containing protein n=1 Tax=Chelatococcus reniformis TaxID=1494448 RepID=A0A916U8Q0_9HYPH|nr:hypothetical protein [Chelatococcus reniformis]GGC64722.1 hypothetical protein GCM10010994_24110 [Chelatococcus reniformis]